MHIMEADSRTPSEQQVGAAVPPASSFTARLQAALNKRGEALEKNELTHLKEDLRVFYLSYTTFYNVLTRKGLINEDPYKHDQKISEIVTPSNSPFLETERVTQMSVRMSEFDSQLDFLNHFYQFSLEFLDLRRIKNLVSLISYIKWGQLSPTSENTTTRVLADLVEKIAKGGDQLSSSILGDSHDQLAKLQHKILTELKSIADVQRESYKLQLRMLILPRTPLPDTSFRDIDDAVKTVKKQFVHVLPDVPYYPELVQEVIQEDFAPNAQQRQEEVLRRLSVIQKNEKKPQHDNELRRILVDGIRALANTSRTIDEAVIKLRDNSLYLETRRLRFSERFRRWVIRALGKKERKEVYEVKYNDITTSAVQHETIEFVDFCTKAERKARLFTGILTRSGTITKRIEGATEDQLFSFLARNITETQLIFRRLQSLDAFFKDTVPEEERPQMRGIKTALTGMKNHIIKANQEKHEYVARKEEEEQFRKLGLDSDLPVT